MKTWFVACALFLFGTTSFSQNADQTWSVRFSDTIMRRYTPNINAMTSKSWEYSNTIILHGMEKVYNWTGDAAYLSYIKNYVDAFTAVNGNSITGWAQTLDKIHPGIVCLFLYEKYKSANVTDSTRYRNLVKLLRNNLITGGYRKSAAGFYDHKVQAVYTDVVMLDGIYMAHPFLVKYGRLFNDNVALDTATSQTLRIADILYVPAKHLLKHAYHYIPGSVNNPSWDDANGVSSQYWSRAMGWYAMAVVDMLKYLPASHPKYTAMRNLLSNIAIGIRDSQDPSGLWWQVMDRPGVAGNYLETSGSAMFVYTIKTAVDSGWISNSFLPVAQNGWTGLQSYITTYNGTLAGGGGPRITSFAPAMSVQDDYNGYISNLATSAPTPNAGAPSGTQNPHGYAAILMAASAMEFPLHTLPVKFGYFTAKRIGNDVLLKWNNTDVDQGVDFYEVQRSGNGINYAVVQKIKSDGGGVYQWKDNNVPGTVAYYRIRAVDLDGKVYHSKIQIVRLNTVQPDMVISPNPVTEGVIKIRFENIQPSQYKLRIVNNSGKTISIKNIQVTGDGSNIQSVALPSSIRKGVYFVRLEAEGIIVTKSILVE
jgi:unsaturated rhamnogalacturonyl hydrolase